MGLSFAWLGVRFDARDPGLPALGLTVKRGLAEANPGTRVRNSPRAFLNEWHEKRNAAGNRPADPDWLRTNHSVVNFGDVRPSHLCSCESCLNHHKIN